MNKKFIIFLSDLEKGDIPGMKRYIKFLDDEKTLAIFYNPLIAPKHLKTYLKENNIVEAYEVFSLNILKSHEDKIYTFSSNKGVYNVNKGILFDEKLVMFIDKGMEISLDLPKYSYIVYKDYLEIKPFKKNSKGSFCYVANKEDVSEKIKSLMLEAKEASDNILYIDDYSNMVKRLKR